MKRRFQRALDRARAKREEKRLAGMVSTKLGKANSRLNESKEAGKVVNRLNTASKVADNRRQITVPARLYAELMSKLNGQLPVIEQKIVENHIQALAPKVNKMNDAEIIKALEELNDILVKVKAKPVAKEIEIPAISYSPIEKPKKKKSFIGRILDKIRH